jgi:hypothetical protein
MRSSKTSKLLGIHRPLLYEKMREWGDSHPSPDLGLRIAASVLDYLGIPESGRLSLASVLGTVRHLVSDACRGAAQT